MSELLDTPLKSPPFAPEKDCEEDPTTPWETPFLASPRFLHPSVLSLMAICSTSFFSEIVLRSGNNSRGATSAGARRHEEDPGNLQTDRPEDACRAPEDDAALEKVLFISLCPRRLAGTEARGKGKRYFLPAGRTRAASWLGIQQAPRLTARGARAVSVLSVCPPLKGRNENHKYFRTQFRTQSFIVCCRGYERPEASVGSERMGQSPLASICEWS